MLTQIQTIEPQAAVLVACPRPRALVFPAPSAAAWPVCAPIAASTRRFASVESVRPLGFAGLEGSAGSARAERRSGYEAVTLLADAASGRPVDDMANASIGMAGTTNVNQQDKQDKQHLTARRGPVTWRPPH